MKRPTKYPQSTPLKTTKASFWTGWTKPLQDVVHTLEADIASLQARLKTPINKGRPASYMGVREFIPESSIVQLDVNQQGVSTAPCNYVVRDGQDYSIPIIFPGPGVFVAHEILVSIFQRDISASKQEMYAGMNTNAYAITNTSSLSPRFTTKFSIYPKQSKTLVPLADPYLPPQHTRTINFFWNMIDTKSQRLLSDSYISHMVLTPRSLPVLLTIGRLVASNFAREKIPDGDLFKLSTPWVFERDGQANFSFRPITPVFQFDSSLPGDDPVVGLDYDDRVNGKRDQRVRVQVELHGYRYETDQDLIRAGALTR